MKTNIEQLQLQTKQNECIEAYIKRFHYDNESAKAKVYCIKQYKSKYITFYPEKSYFATESSYDYTIFSDYIAKIDDCYITRILKSNKRFPKSEIFSDYFMTENEYRKNKLLKLNNLKYNE